MSFLEIETVMSLPDQNTDAGTTLAALEDITVVCIGRFLHKGGYGVATRAFYRALKDANLTVVGIDAQTGAPISDADGKGLEVSRVDGQLKLKARSADEKLLVVFFDTPPQWARLSVKGKAHVVGYTMTETEQVPFDWSYELLSVDQVWTPTSFNRRVFADFGVPPSMVTVMPIAVDMQLFQPKEEVLDFRGANSFRFLTLVSNFNRKDAAGLIRAYVDAFSSDDDVSLIVKLPRKTSNEQIKKYILDPIFPWVDPVDTRLPHIVFMIDELSDEKLIDLYASCHAYVSLERGKGWDLPAMEAMLMGLPSLNVAWSGNTDFQHEENSVQLQPGERTVFANADLVENAELYTGHTWATYDVGEATKALIHIRDNYDEERRKVLGARDGIEKLVSFTNAAQNVVRYAEGLQPHNFRSNDVAEVILAPRENAGLKPPPPKQALFENLPDDVRARLDQPYVKGEDLDKWVANRRAVWSKFGPVLPDQQQRNRLASLRNKYHGQSLFVVGNGPSLKNVDMGVLSQYYTFAANKIYLMFDRTEWRPDFYLTLDWRVTPDNYEEINQLSGSKFFFPHRFRNILREGDDVYWYESLSAGRSLRDKFERNADRGVRGGGTVLTAAMQLGYFLGFHKIFLVGVDASYSIPSTVVQSGGDRFGTGVEINLQSTQNDDINHFDPRYFGKGALWHDPNVEEMKRGFQASYRAVSFFGGEVYNSTIGGSLDCVPRMPLEQALAYADKKP